MGKRLAVVLADHQQVVRDSIATMLATQPDIEIVGKAATCGEALEMVRKNRPDVLVLEVDLPEGSGFEVLRTLAQTGATVPTLILTASENEVDYVQAVRLGASGLVLKRDSAEKLLH